MAVVTAPAAPRRPGRDKNRGTAIDRQNLCRCHTACDADDGAGVLTDCPTLGEAVTAWQRLRPEQKIRATIKVIGGPVYTAHEIDRLYQGPKPA
jgi:hypothetical protein